MINLSLWDVEQLPTLRALAEVTQVGEWPPSIRTIMEMTGLSREQVHRSLSFLLDCDFIVAERTLVQGSPYPRVDRIIGLTKSGHLAAGTLPGGEALVDAVLRALGEHRAQLTPTEASAVDSVTGMLGTSLREVVVGAINAQLWG